MSDTQWPRFEVFKQDTPQKPHEAIGSVHAPDAEMALLHARDVFVRRPQAVSLWVAPASKIFSLTAEEMTTNPAWNATVEDPTAPEQVYYLFSKTSQRRSMTYVHYVGQVQARTAVAALQIARATDAFHPAEAFVWWVIPESAITRSHPDDIPSHFAPALEKTYRQQSAYGLIHLPH